MNTSISHPVMRGAALAALVFAAQLASAADPTSTVKLVGRAVPDIASLPAGPQRNLFEQFEMTLQNLEQFHHLQKGSAAHGEEGRRTVYWRPRF